MSSERDLVWIVEDCWRAVREEMAGIKLSTPAYPDPLWTVRDVLLHCAFWNDESVTSIEAHMNGDSHRTDSGAAGSGAELDAMNQRVVEAARSLPEDEVWARWIDAQDRLTGAVRALDDEAMCRNIMAPWHETMPVAQMVHEELGHERDHINDVLTAVSAQETT